MVTRDGHVETSLHVYNEVADHADNCCAVLCGGEGSRPTAKISGPTNGSALL